LGNVSEGSWGTEVLVFEARSHRRDQNRKSRLDRSRMLSAFTVPGIEEPFADYSSTWKLFEENNLKQLPPAV